MMVTAWLLAAALVAGDPSAQLAQAKVLMRGTPVEQPQARLLFTEAAGQGSAAAAYYLGLMLKNGMGGPQDQAAALHWLTLAAQRQVLPAMFIVANMLVDSDQAQARYWIEAACEAEYPEALQQKAIALGEGRMGYVHDEEQAALFLKMAEHAMGHRQPEP